MTTIKPTKAQVQRLEKNGILEYEVIHVPRVLGDHSDLAMVGTVVIFVNREGVGRIMDRYGYSYNNSQFTEIGWEPHELPPWCSGYRAK
jgi:hypothetical protein